VNWLLKDVRINAVYFRDEIVMRISQKHQSNVSGGHKPWTLVHMDHAKVHIAEMISTVIPDLGLKRTPRPGYSPNICPSDFFLFGWLEGKLQQQQFTDPEQLFEAVDEIFSPVLADRIEEVFQNWIHRLVQVIASDGDYLQ
jgi:hypothetical protein